jgi:LPXTG-site transpeptidase (sortase) family protein
MKKRPTNQDLFVFSIWFIAIFTLSYSALYIIGFIPKELNESGKETVVDTLRQNALEAVSYNTNVVEEAGVLPVKLVVPSVDIDINIENPSTTDPVLLDEHLKKGVVRYPGSGLLGKGNTLLFGHSSNWEVVKNPNYKALNGIEKLEAGDEIKVQSENAVYVYKVTTVRMAKAEEIKIDFSSNKNMITLSTCNTFGAKQDRFIVEAEFERKEAR